MASPPTPRHYQFIDALRGLAFLGVLVTHVVPRSGGASPSLLRIGMHGGEGVQLFFLISAVTLFLSLDARKDREDRWVAKFFIRRFFRIAPLFYAGAVFYYCFDRYVTGGLNSGSASPGCILSTLTFTNGWSVPWVNRLVPGGWSIAVEMNFYLLVPFLFLKIKNVWQAATYSLGALLVGGVLSSVCKILLLRQLGPQAAEDVNRYVWYWFPAQLPIFCLGFVLYFLLRPVLKGEELATEQPRKFAGFLLTLAMYLIVALCFSETVFFLGHALFGVAFMLLAWSLACRPNRLFVNPVMCYIGTVSFSAYLTHFAVLDGVEWGLAALPGDPVSRLPGLARVAVWLGLTLIGTVAVSTLTYRLIELPGQSLGKRVIALLAPRRDPQATQQLVDCGENAQKVM